MNPEFKVYGHIYPADAALEADLTRALACAVQDPLSWDLPLLERDRDMLRISFEGRYFPEEDVVEALQRHVRRTQTGKLDVLNIHDWRMRRYLIANGTITHRDASLNQVLDYSGF